MLNKFEDMNYAEIAEVMGLSTKAVKSLLSRARMNLREALQGYIYMDGEPAAAEDDEDSRGGRGMSDGPPPLPLTRPGRADLVAYLDGELSGEAARRWRRDRPRPGGAPRRSR